MHSELQPTCAPCAPAAGSPGTSACRRSRRKASAALACEWDRRLASGPTIRPDLVDSREKEGLTSTCRAGGALGSPYGRSHGPTGPEWRPSRECGSTLLPWQPPTGSVAAIFVCVSVCVCCVPVTWRSLSYQRRHCPRPPWCGSCGPW